LGSLCKALADKLGEVLKSCLDQKDEKECFGAFKAAEAECAKLFANAGYRIDTCIELFKVAYAKADPTLSWLPAYLEGNFLSSYQKNGDLFFGPLREAIELKNSSMEVEQTQEAIDSKKREREESSDPKQEGAKTISPPRKDGRLTDVRSATEHLRRTFVDATKASVDAIEINSERNSSVRNVLIALCKGVKELQVSEGLTLPIGTEANLPLLYDAFKAIAEKAKVTLRTSANVTIRESDVSCAKIFARNQSDESAVQTANGFGDEVRKAALDFLFYADALEHLENYHSREFPITRYFYSKVVCAYYSKIQQLDDKTILSNTIFSRDVKSKAQAQLGRVFPSSPMIVNCFMEAIEKSARAVVSCIEEKEFERVTSILSKYLCPFSVLLERAYPIFKARRLTKSFKARLAKDSKLKPKDKDWEEYDAVNRPSVDTTKIAASEKTVIALKAMNDQFNRHPASLKGVRDITDLTLDKSKVKKLVHESFALTKLITTAFRNRKSAIHALMVAKKLSKITEQPAETAVQQDRTPFSREEWNHGKELFTQEEVYNSNRDVLDSLGKYSDYVSDAFEFDIDKFTHDIMKENK